jgi:hypothetical protein
MSGSFFDRLPLNRMSHAGCRTAAKYPAAMVLIAAITLAGCSQKKVDNRKAVFPVHGKLLVDNQPAPGALLVLHPVGGSYDAERPVATVGPDGGFEVTTYVTKDGAPPGEYIVTAQWYLSANKEAPGPWPNVIPDKYARPESSDLRVRVAEGSNDLQPIVIKR